MPAPDLTAPPGPRPDLPRSSGEPRRGWKLAGRVFLVLVAAMSLQVLGPTLAVVYTTVGDVVHLHPAWLLVITASECTSFVCLWWLMRLVIRTSDWRVVARAQLVGNAVSQVVPGGAATGAAVQMRMLTTGGVDKATAVSGLPVVGLITAATVFVSPVFALPALLTVPDVPRQLVVAAGLGVAGSLLLGGALTVFLVTTRPLELAAGVVQRLWNKVVRHHPFYELPAKIVEERDSIRERLGDNKRAAALAAVGTFGFDYLALLAALAAVGARPEPGLVLLAFVAAKLLGMIPVTPGGLGFVEAGLTGTLALTGISTGQAVVATAAYRVVSYFLPVMAGVVAYGWHKVDMYEAAREELRP
ncbi:MAG TPA: lysylphosphatidylglycerol synthase transmembrane domain-containing protein [Acidimicrobiales bacterium]